MPYKFDQLYSSFLSCYLNAINKCKTIYKDIFIYLYCRRENSETKIWINPLKTEFLPNNIYESSSYHTRNILRLRYKAQPVNGV
jgi:hypothetical protein